MLGLMIHAHPRLAMPPETRFLRRAWRHRQEFGDLGTAAQHRALAEAITLPSSKIRDLGLSPADLRAKILEAPPTLGSAFEVVLREFANLHGKARFGDKRPSYYAEVDVLLRLFPDAQIIQVVRDGRANVASLKRMPWWHYSSVRAMASWSLAESCMRRSQSRLPADTFHVVRYESLVAEPRAVLGELCDFLEEDFDEAMLEPHQVAEVVPQRKVWHQNLKTAVNTSAVDAWRDGLEPWEIGLMESVLGRKLRRNGYELSGLGERPTVQQLRRYAHVSRTLRAATRARWAAEARDARVSSGPVAAQLTRAQREPART